MNAWQRCQQNQSLGCNVVPLERPKGKIHRFTKADRFSAAPMSEKLVNFLEFCAPCQEL